MKRILAASLLVSFVAGVAAADADDFPNLVLPPHTVVGNTLPVTAGANAIPFAVLSSNLGLSLGPIAGLNIGTGLSSDGSNLNIANQITAGGPIGSATAVPILTWNARGQLTVVSSATITPAFSSITGTIAAGQFSTGPGIIAGNMFANANASTLFGNSATSAGAPGFFAPTSLTNKVTPIGADVLLLVDSAASNALKFCTLTQCLGAVTSGVSSIAGNTGAFTLGGGVTNSTNQIIIDQTASLTWTGTEIFTNSKLKLLGSSTGATTFASANAGASNFTLTFPAITSTISTTIASGATAMGTGAITSGACATAVTGTATGTLTTDVITASFNGDPTAITGYIPSTSGMLTIIAYPTADTANFKVCNNTGASITPGAVTINWRVVR